VAGNESGSIIIYPNGSVPFLFFQGVNRGMTVTFKMHSMVRTSGVWGELQCAARDQEPPIP
jgi:hypothetical protein